MAKAAKQVRRVKLTLDAKAREQIRKAAKACVRAAAALEKTTG
jgi:hypothetical protein